jgi:hypothetical protein
MDCGIWHLIDMRKEAQKASAATDRRRGSRDGRIFHMSLQIAKRQLHSQSSVLFSPFPCPWLTENSITAQLRQCERDRESSLSVSLLLARERNDCKINLICSASYLSNERTLCLCTFVVCIMSPSLSLARQGVCGVIKSGARCRSERILFHYSARSTTNLILME